MRLDARRGFLVRVEGNLRSGLISDRNKVRCLKWSLRSVVDGLVCCRRLWKGGCLVDFWVEFGRKQRAVVRGIVWWVVLGCGWLQVVFQGRLGGGMAGERCWEMTGFLGEVGRAIGRKMGV